jgi:hypothetical protein
MTRTRYQTSAASPTMGNSHLAHRHLRFRLTTRPVFPQTSKGPFSTGIFVFLFFNYFSQPRLPQEHKPEAEPGYGLIID